MKFKNSASDADPINQSSRKRLSLDMVISQAGLTCGNRDRGIRFLIRTVASLHHQPGTDHRPTVGPVSRLQLTNTASGLRQTAVPSPNINRTHNLPHQSPSFSSIIQPIKSTLRHKTTNVPKLTIQKPQSDHISFCFFLIFRKEKNASRNSNLQQPHHRRDRHLRVRRGQRLLPPASHRG